MASCCLFSFQGCKGYLCTLQVYILTVLRRTIWLLKHYVWTKSNTLIQSCRSTDLALTDMEPVYLHTACSHSITRRKNTACNPLTGPLIPDPPLHTHDLYLVLVTYTLTHRHSASLLCLFLRIEKTYQEGLRDAEEREGQRLDVSRPRPPWQFTNAKAWLV